MLRGCTDFTSQCPSAKSFPIFQPSTMSHFPDGPGQISGGPFLQVLLNSSKPVLQRHFWCNKKALTDSLREGSGMKFMSCLALLISSRWTNLLNCSLFLPDLDMSSESLHFSLSLESPFSGTTTETKNEQVWTSVLQKVPEIKSAFHLKSVPNSINL